jgi:hypothetical protein
MSHTNCDIGIKSGHLWPFVEATLDLPGDMSLSGCEVYFVLNTLLYAPVLDKPAIIVDEALRSVRYEWEPGDTDTPGIFYGEFYVVRPDGKPTGAPNDNHLTIAIYPSLSRGE